MNPEFSVIIPSYNHEEYIGDAIESVINQTFKDWELIIIDDGSTDNSVEVIRRYEDPRIKLFTQTNHDAPYTINRGMKEARGKYIAILNSDDLFDPIKLEECKKYLSKGYEFVFGKLKVINDKNQKISGKDERVMWIDKHLNNFKEEPTLKKLLLNINYIITTSNLSFNRKVLEKVGYFHEKLRISHDFDYLIRIFEKDLRIKFIPEYLASYRIHSKNTLSRGRVESFLESCYAMDGLFRRNTEMRKKFPLSFFHEPIIKNILSFYASLSDKEAAEIAKDKENPNRKKLEKMINSYFAGSRFSRKLKDAITNVKQLFKRNNK
ncbi:MAG: glycosyltransferase [Candidatus Moranbacteria bacterium]|nr:glycosyltransferase [Candidatus Moranbacteria bacterium]